jgi:hypothetical protein
MAMVVVVVVLFLVLDLDFFPALVLHLDIPLRAADDHELRARMPADDITTAPT